MLSRSIRIPARKYSTQSAVEAAGIKVVARDAEVPVSRVAVVVNAGSRNGPIGSAHLLKNFAFHTSSSTKSGLRRWREGELVGGSYSASLGREKLVLNAQFLRSGLPHFVENVADVMANSVYKPHEFSEHVLPQSIHEAQVALSNPATLALEKAHQVAFRRGLGNPLYVQDYSPVSLDEVASLGKEAYSKSNITVYATGVDTQDFTDLVSKHFKKLSAGSPITNEATKTFGGESRVSSHDNAVVIAFPNKNGLIASLLGGETAVKWSAGQSPLAIAGIKTHTNIKASSVSYSDASLLYVTVTGSTAADVSAGTKEAVQAIKGLSNATEEQVNRAVAKAKFDQAAKSDADFVYSLSGEAKSVDAASLKKDVAELTKGPIVLSVVGNVQELPYLDELF